VNKYFIFYLLFVFVYSKGGLSGVGFESGLVEGAGGAYGSSSFESSSYSSGVGGGAGGYSVGGGAGGYSVDGGLVAGGGGAFNTSSYESASYGSGGAGGGGAAGGFDVAAAAFNSADKNKDGNVDANEFKQFYQGGL
jgi:hypothetical protein